MKTVTGPNPPEQVRLPTTWAGTLDQVVRYLFFLFFLIDQLLYRATTAMALTSSYYRVGG